MQGNATAGAVYCYADLQTGTITDSGVSIAGTGTTFTSASIEPFANNTYRVSVTGIVNSADTGIYVQASLSDRSTQGGTLDSGKPQYVGSTKSVYFWGAQLELASFPSSYIPTTTTSATRAADAVTGIGSFATVASASAGSALCETGPLLNTVNANAVILDRDSAGNHSYLGAHNDNQSIIVVGGAGTSLTGNNLPGSLLFSTSTVKTMMAWDGGGRSVVGGGATVATDANSIGASSGTPMLGLAGPNTLWGYMHRVTLWNTRLADATLQTLTR
jgi:hypothetical protein